MIKLTYVCYLLNVVTNNLAINREWGFINREWGFNECEVTST